MEYLNRFKLTVNSTVHSVAAQVSQALPGNPIFREYECHEQIASAGPGLVIFWFTITNIKYDFVDMHGRYIEEPKTLPNK